MTIRELADELRVSHAAVSYALNGRPGVSESTRARIVSAARARGWQPSMAARALAGQGTGSIGFVLARSVDELARDSFYLAFIAGVHAELAPRGMTMTFQVVDSVRTECQVYRQWAAQARVDGLLLVDPRRSDPRIPLMVSLGLPAVVVGTRQHRDLGPPVVWADDRQPMIDAVHRLSELGHRAIGRISGPAGYAHTQERGRAYRAAMAALGLPPLPAAGGPYLEQTGADGLERLHREHGVTAVVCDNDALAIGALLRARELGLRVPADLSIISWEDSVLCRSASPQLTAIRRDPFAFGRRVAAVLLATIPGCPAPAEPAEPEAAVLIERESTGPAAAVRG